MSQKISQEREGEEATTKSGEEDRFDLPLVQERTERALAEKTVRCWMTRFFEGWLDPCIGEFPWGFLYYFPGSGLHGDQQITEIEGPRL